MADSRLIAITTQQGLRPLGVHGQPVAEAHGQITRFLARRLSPRHAALFAEPNFNIRPGEIEWYAPLEGTLARLDELPLERQNEVKAELGKLVDDIAGVARALKAAKEPGDQLLGQIVEFALNVPGEAYVFAVGAQPVLAAWGHVEDRAGAEGAVLQRMVAAPQAAGGGVVMGPAMVAERRAWWPWLLLFFVLVMLLGALLLPWLARPLLAWLDRPGAFCEISPEQIDAMRRLDGALADEARLRRDLTFAQAQVAERSAQCRIAAPNTPNAPRQLPNAPRSVAPGTPPPPNTPIPDRTGPDVARVPDDTRVPDGVRLPDGTRVPDGVRVPDGTRLPDGTIDRNAPTRPDARAPDTRTPDGRTPTTPPTPPRPDARNPTTPGTPPTTPATPPGQPRAPGQASAPPAPADIQDRLNRDQVNQGEASVSLGWNTADDLDLAVECPNGQRISWRQREACGGTLDRDMNQGVVTSDEPVENISFPSVAAAPAGRYRISVDNRSANPVGYRVRVTVRGQTREFTGTAQPNAQGQAVGEFTLPN